MGVVSGVNIVSGFTEVQGYISPTPEASLLAISTGEVSAAASGNVEGENALGLDIVGCRLHRAPSQEQSSVLESSAASITITGASTKKSMHMPVYIDKRRSTTETMPDNAVHINFSTASVTSSTVAAETLSRDATDIHPGIIVEAAIETLTTAAVNTFAINLPSSKSYPGAECR